MVKITVYTHSGEAHEFLVASIEMARAIAQKIVMEGFWHKEQENEIFLPMTEVKRVKVEPSVPETIEIVDGS